MSTINITIDKLKRSIPNTLTFIRLLMMPWLAIILYDLDAKQINTTAATLFMIASATDFLDGYLARHWSVQSKLGSLLDPIADKIIVITAIIMLIYAGRISDIHIFAALIIICRETIMSDWREFNRINNDVIPRVNSLAQTKTATQMVALALLILDNHERFNLTSLANIALWLSAALSMITVAVYIRNNILGSAKS